MLIYFHIAFLFPKAKSRDRTGPDLLCFLRWSVLVCSWPGSCGAEVEPLTSDWKMADSVPVLPTRVSKCGGYRLAPVFGSMCS